MNESFAQCMWHALAYNVHSLNDLLLWFATLLNPSYGC